jgi:hypothetical protein
VPSPVQIEPPWIGLAIRDFRHHYFGAHKRLTKKSCEEFLAMTGISSCNTQSFLLSPRTANYVAALIRQGDKFDYCKWLRRVREEEAKPTQVFAGAASGETVAKHG